MPSVRLFWHAPALAFALVCLCSAPSTAAERFCDPSFEDCRTPLLSLIANERVGIDAGFWFMEDARYTTALIKRFQAGVPVRVLVDPRANTKNPQNAYRLKELADAGIPMRKCISNGIMHWKAMIFAGQYFRQQFVRKWNNKTGNIETAAFTPLPPETPAYAGPSNGVRQPTTGIKLAWKPGYWAHKADVYFGTTPDPPLVARDVAVTPKSTSSYALPPLLPGRTYYWRIVSKTMANKTKAGAIWSFGT